MKQITIYDLLPLLKKEEWKPLLNGKYFISNFGRVYSSYSKGIMKPFETKKGYLQVCLFDKGKKKGWLVHRLVAMEFIPNESGCEQINHKDCNKQNNRVENLEWCSALENVRHAVKNGRIVFSEERRKVVSERQKKRDLSENVRLMRLANLGKPKSKETRTKIGEKQIGKLNHRARSIICIETGKVFNTIRQASEEIFCTSPNISASLKNEAKTAGGYHWKYKEV